MLVTLFRVCGFLGTVLLGAALAIAPIAAFEDRMTLVSGLGIAGIVLLLVAWALRKLRRPPAEGSDPQP